MIKLTNYADSTAVTNFVSKFVEDPTTETFTTSLNRALQSADDTINNQLDETTIPSTVPNVIKTIAYYLSVVELLDEYATAQGERNDIAIAWEKKALKMLEDYPKDEGNEDSKPSQQYYVSQTSKRRPWRGSLTRGRRY